LGTNDGVGLAGTGDTVSATADTVGINAGDTATVTGNSDAVNLGTGATATVTGTSESVSATSDAITLGSGSSATITGNSDTLTLAGTADHVTLNGTGEVLSGSSDTLTFDSESSGTIQGNNDSVTLGTYGTSVNADGTGDVISASEDTIYLAEGESLTVTGTDDYIIGDGSNTIHVTGTYDEVYADSSTVDFSGTDTDDWVHGSGDTGSGWYGYVGESGGYGGYGGGGYYDAKVNPIKPGSSKESATSAHGTRVGLADIASIGAADHMLNTAEIDPADNALDFSTSGSSILDAAWSDDQVARNDRSPIRTSVTAQRTASANSPTIMVHQLIHAMATWPAGVPSSMFSPSSDTFEAASVQPLARPSPESRARVEIHAHLA